MIFAEFTKVKCISIKLSNSWKPYIINISILYQVLHDNFDKSDPQNLHRTTNIGIIEKLMFKIELSILSIDKDLISVTKASNLKTIPNLKASNSISKGHGSGCTTALSGVYRYLYRVYCLTPPTSLCSANTQNLHSSTVERILKQCPHPRP